MRHQDSVYFQFCFHLMHSPESGGGCGCVDMRYFSVKCCSVLYMRFGVPSPESGGTCGCVDMCYFIVMLQCAMQTICVLSKL